MAWDERILALEVAVEMAGHSAENVHASALERWVARRKARARDLNQISRALHPVRKPRTSLIDRATERAARWQREVRAREALLPAPRLRVKRLPRLPRSSPFVPRTALASLDAIVRTHRAPAYTIVPIGTETVPCRRCGQLVELRKGCTRALGHACPVR